MVSKSDSDDQLIETLQQEISRLKAETKSLTAALRQKEAEGIKRTHVEIASGARKLTAHVDADSLEKELRRMARVCEQQVRVVVTDCVVKCVFCAGTTNRYTREYYP